jgi:hypothetical protein
MLRLGALAQQPDATSPQLHDRGNVFHVVYSQDGGKGASTKADRNGLNGSMAGNRWINVFHTT